MTDKVSTRQTQLNSLTALLERRLEVAEREGNETLKNQLEKERQYLAGRGR